MIKIAFGSVPKDGGTFTFFRNLRPLLLEQGIELTCVSVGKDQADLTDQSFVVDGCVQLAPNSTGLKIQAQAFEQWFRDERMDIVFGVNSPAILSAIPHLPSSARILARCANGFEEGYKLTLVGRDRLMRVVALTPRLKTDLVADFGVSPEDIILIPNGADQSRFDPSEIEKTETGLLKLSFLGRLEHNQKGVLHLPAVMKRLDERGVDYHLKIAGKGKNEPELRAGLKTQLDAGRVEFVGPLTPSEVPDFLTQSDVYLFPSHFEGCPNALLEAMMAGAVPVSWRLEGITDFLILENKTGLLAETGNVTEFADKIDFLAANRGKLQDMHKALFMDARNRFSTEKCAAEYVDFFRQIMREEPPAVVPRPWSQFQPDILFQERFINRLIPAQGRRVLKSLAQHAKHQMKWRSHA